MPSVSVHEEVHRGRCLRCYQVVEREYCGHQDIVQCPQGVGFRMCRSTFKACKVPKSNPAPHSFSHHSLSACSWSSLQSSNIEPWTTLFLTITPSVPAHEVVQYSKPAKFLKSNPETRSIPHHVLSSCCNSTFEACKVPQLNPKPHSFFTTRTQCHVHEVV